MVRRRRLLLATAVLLSSAGCTGQVGGGARPDEPARTTHPQPRLSTTSVEAKAVLGTTDLAAGGSVAVAPARGRVAVGYGDGSSTTDHPGVAVVNFGPLPGPASCIAHVALDVSLSSPPRTPSVAVYPVDPRYHALAAGDVIDGWALLLDNRPRGVVTFDGRNGQADVTDLAKAFVAGSTRSNGRYVKGGSEIVVSVQPENMTSTATFELLATDPVPRLTVTRSC